MNAIKSIVRLCQEKGVEIEDLNAILALYDDDDRPEEEILDELDKYPEPARELASFLILGI